MTDNYFYLISILVTIILIGILGVLELYFNDQRKDK